MGKVDSEIEIINKESKVLFEAIKKHDKILLLSHISPDPDALGSLFSMSYVLKRMKKEFLAFTAEPVPDSINVLNGAEFVSHEWNEGFVPELIIMMDTPTEQMLGDDILKRVKLGDAETISIDHHATNPKNEDICIIHEKVSCACEILYHLFVSAKIVIDKTLASFLLLGILGDTGTFKNANVSSRVLNVAGSLVESGADIYQINEQLYKRYQMKDIYLWGKLMSRTQDLFDGKVIWTSVSKEMAEEYGHNGAGVRSDVLSFFLQEKECVFALLFIHDGEFTKISLRSTRHFNCITIASAFGGGGHKAAAGIRVKGSLEEVEQKIMLYVSQHFKDCFISGA